ncbi:MAG TPA: helix-turn-helix transcriptional regulator, partial [Thermomicrobiales bacterium]|nr:helix-turn-helix transcriptional regulator [Thermomicrobiales bacterium]
MERTVGDVLREWRRRRHLSQLDLATEAEISPRHLSFVETGRSNPSRDLLIHLADQLKVPLRERNALLTAGGYAPVYQQKPLDDPTLAAAKEAVQVMLRCHEPNPAVAIDRHWNLIAANRTIGPLLVDVAPELLEPPINILRLAMHPGGLASRIVNVQEFGNLLVERLRHEIEISGDPELVDLAKELVAFQRGQPGVVTSSAPPPNVFGIAVPFQLRTDEGILSFFNMTTVFGTATEVTLS